MMMMMMSSIYQIQRRLAWLYTRRLPNISISVIETFSSFGTSSSLNISIVEYTKGAFRRYVSIYVIGTFPFEFGTSPLLNANLMVV